MTTTTTRSTASRPLLDPLDPANVLPVLVVYFITQKQFTEGIATSGLKG